MTIQASCLATTMSTYRPRRNAQNAVNAPVVAHVKGMNAISKSRAEAILTKFISTSESIAATVPGSTDEITFTNTGMSNMAGSNPVLGQLKRVQRDLRGLPPLLAELETGKHGLEENSEQRQNKKIKFDEEETETVDGGDDAGAEDIEIDEAAEEEIDEAVEEVDEAAVEVEEVADELEEEAAEEIIAEEGEEEEVKKGKKEKRDRKSVV